MYSYRFAQKVAQKNPIALAMPRSIPLTAA